MRLSHPKLYHKFRLKKNLGSFYYLITFIIFYIQFYTCNEDTLSNFEGFDSRSSLNENFIILLYYIKMYLILYS